MIFNISIDILEQLKRHISQLTPVQYASKLDVFNGSSIGGHSRHIIEFYDCLLNSIESNNVNYDARLRDLQIENNRDYAILIINKIINKLEQFDNFDKNVVLISKFGNCELSTPTTFQREITYLIEHTIHHFALIRIGIQSCFEKIKVEHEFGVAFSTLEFRNQKQKV